MKTFLNIGVFEENLDSLNGRVRLHNFSALFIIIVAALSIPFYAVYHFTTLMVVSIAIILISLFSMYLQSRKEYILSFGILTFSMIILINIICLNFGLIVNFHFFLICCCMTAFILFERHKVLRNISIGISIFSFFTLTFHLRGNKSLLKFPEELSTVLEVYGHFNFLVLFAFSLIFFYTFLKQKVVFQRAILQQNLILEDKNSQITDSIRYAKHIQNAILPPVNALREHLKESFVFYKPKDIVAGDFYWMEKQGDLILFAAADSTGHGVPGAMVSVVCTNALNQAVKEFGLRDPGLILDKVRELVVAGFQKSDSDVKDGMDISLCVIDTKNLNLKWAGANNPLWIIRNHSDELSILKPDKQSVALTEKPSPFTTHSVQLEKGDCFYLFTDGYADQFGGESAKKFMQKRLKELLLRIYKKPMELQKHLIHDNILNWMGNLEQVDDMCFVGVRV